MKHGKFRLMQNGVVTVQTEGRRDWALQMVLEKQSAARALGKTAEIEELRGRYWKTLKSENVVELPQTSGDK